ncbi:MAG: tRNA pseudouridine(55) synthase TruB [Chloroflexota bacterium]
MAKREPNYHGLLIVDKPGRGTRGLQAERAEVAPLLPTSHDVVQMARRWTRQRRVGHTGTLDPMASGILVLCLGHATRLVEYYQNHAKTYYAEIYLGIATDTYDAMGKVTEQATIPKLSRRDIEAALDEYKGDILQVPPLYSAIKQGGESLHQKARRGENITVEPRRVTFHHIELVDYVMPERISIRVTCSAGTYIRSLAYDLGRSLGTLGYLDYLRRETAGQFQLNHAHTVDTIENVVSKNQLDTLLLPTGAYLDMPSIQVNEDELRYLGFGQSITLQGEVNQKTSSSGFLAIAKTDEGHFAGIIRCLDIADTTAAGPTWKAEKWFMSHKHQ